MCFRDRKLGILIQISLKFVPEGPIGNQSALVQLMDWRQTIHKLLPETKLTKMSDAIGRH